MTEREEELYSLADGAENIVELYKTDSPAGEDWRKRWLERWRKLEAEYVADRKEQVKSINNCDLNTLCRMAHATAVQKGWWDAPRNEGELIALMHSELSEALEALRKPDRKDEHLPDMDPVGLELADTLIRIFDYCGYKGIDLGGCVAAKMKYNGKRPYKHGGKSF